MTTAPLEHLNTVDFSDSMGFDLPPAAMRVALQNSRAVQKLAAAIRRGQITPSVIRKFVGERTDQLERGKRFSGTLVLAALAVALESAPLAFAEEYLCDLSRLELSEMLTCVRVARECLKHRQQLPVNEVRTFRYSSPPVVPSRPWVQAHVPAHNGQRHLEVQTVDYAEVKRATA